VNNIKILLVEDDKRLTRLLQIYLKDFGYENVSIAASGTDAIELARKTRQDLLIMDIILEGTIDGIQAAKEIRSMYDVPVIYLTGFSDDAMLDELKRTEPYGYILKPPDPRHLKIMIEVALYKNNIEKKLKESEMWFHSALKSISDGVIVFDRSGKIKFVNPVAGFMMDCNEHENSFGIEMLELFNNVDKCLRDDVKSLVSNVMNNATYIKNDNIYTVSTKNKGAIKFNIEATPIIDDKENLIGAILFLKSVTAKNIS
jgi:DNA-binding response OmpR family regulator